MPLSGLLDELLGLPDEAMAAFLSGLDDDERALVDAALAEAEELHRQAEGAERQRRHDESVAARHARWFRDPAGFAAEAFTWPEGTTLRPYQADALSRLGRRRRLALRSLHGAGKTGTGAMAVIWFAVTREQRGVGWKIPTTASVWRQLEKYLWPEIRLWVGRLRWDLLGVEPWRRGRDLLDMGIKLQHGEAFAAASDDPAYLEGAHAPQMLYVFDEAKAIRPETFDAAEGAFSTAGSDTGDEAYALAMSTPAGPVGRFADICHHRDGYGDWDALHVTLELAIAAGAVSREWADLRRKQWGENSALYRNRVLGEFADDETDSIIPLAWVEAANDRWAAMSVDARRLTVTHVGVDVARYGADESVFVSIAGDFVAAPYRPGAGDTQWLAARLLPRVGGGPAGPVVVIDADNIGAGLFDELSNMHDPVRGFWLRHRVHAFRGGLRTDWTDATGQLRFANLRAAAWWNLRDLLDPRNGATLALPPDDLLTGDLTTPRWRETGGRILVESKGDLRGRIGRSTDTGDAVVYACWGRRLGVLAVTNPSSHKGRPGLTDDLLTAAL